MRKKLGRLLAVILTLYPCAQAAAQAPMASGADFQPPTVTMQQAFAFNVAVGGAIAAFRAHIAGRSAWSAFKTGAVGGGAHFLGKEIGVERHSLARRPLNLQAPCHPERSELVLARF